MMRLQKVCIDDIGLHVIVCVCGQRAINRDDYCLGLRFGLDGCVKAYIGLRHR